MSDLGAFYSLGGCQVHEVAARLGAQGGGHIDHFWRRPTIALMSEPVSRFTYNLHKLPPAYANYFVNDATCMHRAEISQIRNGENIIFDITRDVFTDVIELEFNSFITNPASAANLIEDLNAENMNSQVVEEILKFSPRKISAYDDLETFFSIWKSAFDKQIALFKQNFDNIFLLEIYFTTKTATDDQQSPSEDHAILTNSILQKMYDSVRSEKDIHVISIDRSKMITGATSKWGGPHHTHFVCETHALYCDKIVRLLSQDRENENKTLEITAFERVKMHEDAKRDIEKLKISLKEAESKIIELNEKIKYIEPIQERFTKTENILKCTNIEIDRMNKQHLFQENLIKDLESLNAKTLRELNELRRPIGAKLKKVAARKTYGWRKAMGLTTQH